MSKLAKMQRYVPSVYRPTSNVNIKGLLEAWATEDDLVVSSIADTKEQIYVATAQLDYLDSLAANVGVFRPRYLYLSDTLFRLLVPALSYYPKQVVPTIYKVLDVFFGRGGLVPGLQEYSFALVDIGSPSGLQIGDTITIAGVEFVAGTTNDGLNFRINTDEDSATNIALTSLSLAKAIRNSGSFLSAVVSESGVINVVSTLVGMAKWYVTSSRSVCWEPGLPSSGFTQYSTSDNPDIKVTEISPNEVNIQIPYAVSAFRRSLIGACHLSGYCGTITSIDDANHNIVVQFYQDRYASRSIAVDELIGMSFSQGGFTEEILDNTVSTAGAVTLHFSIGADLTRYTQDKQFVVIDSNYPGSHIPNPNAEFTLTSYRGILGQNIVAGSTHTTLTMTDASSIPDDTGTLVLDFGKGNEESGIRYLGRPNNRLLSIDASYVFEKDHAIGEVVTVIVQPYRAPRGNGSDYSAYLVDVEYARLLAQDIVETLVAAGIVVNWTVVPPQINR